MISSSNFLSDDKGTFKSFANGFLPSVAVIPVQSECKNTSVLVEVGDAVSEGQVVAKSDSFVVHSSIPGKVIDISTEQLADGKQGTVVRIRLCGEFSFLGKPNVARDWRALDSSHLTELFRDYGIVNTFEKCAPLYSQVKSSKAKVLFVRLFDDDPSRVSESFIAEKSSEKVIEGSAILARTMGVSGVVFAYEKNVAAIRKIYELLDEKSSDLYGRFSPLFDDIKIMTVPVDSKKYPSGTMKNLISAAKVNARSFSKKMPEYAAVFSKTSLKDMFVDSQTVESIYDAVVFRRPVMNRFVHVTGEALNAAAILNVKIGTTLRQLVEQCGGLKKRLAKIVINGTVLGYSVGSIDIPVMKMVKSVEFIPDYQSSDEHTEVCVRCGLCRKICPAHLWPGNIYRATKLAQRGESQDSEYEKAVIDSAHLCIDCGLCNSVCPSRIPIRQTIDFAKKELLSENSGSSSESEDMIEYEI